MGGSSKSMLLPFNMPPVTNTGMLGFLSGGGGSAGGAPMYQLLGRTTLTGAGDTVDVASLDAKNNLMILYTTIADGTCSNKFTVNGVTDTEYDAQNEGNGGGVGTNTGEANWALNYTSDNNYRFGVICFENNASTKKLGFQNMVQSTGGASTDVPNRNETFMGWQNTTDQITRVTMTNDKTGSYNTGTEVVVLGSNPDDSGDNVWQELASVEITSDGDAIDTGTFDAKDYLWFQLYNVDNGTGDLEVRLNALTSGYAERYSDDFGSDATNDNMGGLSGNYGALQGNSFSNYFMINKSGQQKLVTYNVSIESGSAGTAPKTMQAVSNCTTTDQITRIQATVGGGNFGDGSFLKVWGFD